MKTLKSVFIVLIVLTGIVSIASCGKTSAATGLLLGGVTIGPITPVQTPGQVVNVPPETFSSRKVLVYDVSGTKLLQSVNINQIGQTASGYYSVQLAPGTYTIDVTRTGGVGGSSDVPKKIQIVAGQTVTLDINIDTGIR